MSPKVPRPRFRSSEPAEDGGPLEARVEELERQLEQLRGDLVEQTPAEAPPSEPTDDEEARRIEQEAPPSEPTDDEKARLIEQGRAELPNLDAKVEKGLDELRRLAAR
jgi:hypothetical protein